MRQRTADSGKEVAILFNLDDSHEVIIRDEHIVIGPWMSGFFAMDTPNTEVDFTPIKFGTTGLPTPPITEIRLALTHRCTFQCSYCYDKHNAYKPDMSLGTACATVEFFAERLIGTGKPLLVSLSAAGEPTLVKYLEILVRYAGCITVETGVPITFGIITNGSLLNAGMLRKLGDLGIWVGMSFDGPPDLHNRQRRDTDGEATYDKVLEGFRLIQKVLGYTPGICASLTAVPEMSVVEVFRHFYRLGVFSLSTNPVRHWNLGVTKETVGFFKESYMELVDLLLYQDAGQLDRLSMLTYGDAFWRFVRRLARKEFGYYRCPAARSAVTVDTDGRIYPCQDFLGISTVEIGNALLSQIDDKQRKPFIQDYTCDLISECSRCWCRYLCGGPCLAESRIVDGVTVPCKPRCDLNKAMIEMAAYFVTKLRKQSPGLLEEAFRISDEHISGSGVKPEGSNS